MIVIVEERILLLSAWVQPTLAALSISARLVQIPTEPVGEDHISYIAKRMLGISVVTERRRYEVLTM